MRIRQGDTEYTYRLELNQGGVYILFDTAVTWVGEGEDTRLFRGNCIVCTLIGDDARTFNMLYKEFITR